MTLEVAADLGYLTKFLCFPSQCYRRGDACFNLPIFRNSNAHTATSTLQVVFDRHQCYDTHAHTCTRRDFCNSHNSHFYSHIHTAISSGSFTSRSFFLSIFFVFFSAVLVGIFTALNPRPAAAFNTGSWC